MVPSLEWLHGSAAWPDPTHVISSAPLDLSLVCSFVPALQVRCLAIWLRRSCNPAWLTWTQLELCAGVFEGDPWSQERESFASALLAPR